MTFEEWMVENGHANREEDVNDHNFSWHELSTFYDEYAYEMGM